ncbi:LysE family translocator [Actinoplanes subglobosus]|uniref:LysE family translocator n=1 Tax=Actinoplanes subglobosus TaxID=1547892 RepID=A0ABV8IHL2_9ACTN
MPTHLAAFIATVALLAMLPGANNAAITRQTLHSGRRAGLLTVAGSSTGILIWASAAAVGLSAVLLTNPDTYLLLRLAGAAVLCILGLQSLWAIRKPAAAPDAQPTTGHAGRRSYAVGVAASLGNPKAGVVAVSLIPQFVTAHGSVLASSIALGAIWAAVSGTWFCLYVWIIDKARARAGRPGVQRLMHAATGVTMLGLGVAVAINA